jgi:hypothetical protein
MRKVFSIKSYALLLCSVGVISFTFLYANNSSRQLCPDTVKCAKELPTEDLNDSGGRLWESLSSQFVISIVPK